MLIVLKDKEKTEFIFFGDNSNFLKILVIF
jgi:hypothetical protein